MQSPRLPWEVIERVIDLSNGRPNTLCSLALTCRQLRTRSHLTMFGRMQLESRDHVFAFIDFLLANPELKPLVHTIVATPAGFVPSLLYVLPNLSSIECVDESQLGEPEDEDREDEDEGDDNAKGNAMPNTPDYMRLPISVRVHRSLAMHHTSLACFGRLGAHIHTLYLRSISFPTSLAFAQMLLAFAHITRLVCEKVEIETAGHEAPLEVATPRLSERMQLKALMIDSLSLAWDDERHAASPGGLLFDRRLAPCHVENLVIEVSQLDLEFPHREDWCKLQRLVLQFSADATAAGIVAFLERFQNTPRLRDIVVEWWRSSRRQLVEDLSHNVNAHHPEYQVFQKLERTLLRFPCSKTLVVVADPADARVLSFWARELEKHMPLLLTRGGAVTVACRDGPVAPASPHHDAVQALVVSPDSKWVATASLDSTIVLWDAARGALVERWVPHSYTPAVSVTFSPDSRYLVSGGDDRKAVIWDFGHGRSTCKMATLEGHGAPVVICSWSPDGDTIATGSEDGTARLWDARTTTYHQRALIQLKDAVVSLAFSANGSWLACGSRRGECCIVNVALGTVHRSLWNSPSGSSARSDVRYSDPSGSSARSDDRHSDWRATGTISAFDPTCGSARLATAPCGSCAGINVVDVETGSVRAHMGGKMGELMHMQDVAFSPDGTLVLGVSGSPPRPLRNAVCIWRADTGADRFKLTGHTENVRRACFSPCGRYIASAAADRTVRVWRTGGRWPCVATLSEHGEAVEHVAFSPDGRTLSSGARDGTIVIRQMRDIVFAEEQEQDLEQLLSGPHPTSSVDPTLHPWLYL